MMQNNCVRRDVISKMLLLQHDVGYTIIIAINSISPIKHEKFAVVPAPMSIECR